MTNNAANDAPINKVEDFDDPVLPLRRALNFGSMALVAITILSLAVWGGMRGLPGIWGVVIGAGIGGGFVLLTVVSVLAASKTSPTNTIIVVMGSWLVKILVLIIILAVIRDLEFYDKMAMFVAVVLALLATLGTEAWGVVSARVSYVH
ncbi:hypothetical protein AZH46_09215 [Corynebacterium striatum]|uniref:hypothetical protein n=2 Tax=Corynebacterium striatum TaxID=43770 RepID=UPI000C3EA88F|nr:hypothetical protein [Corynebacterium striatum]MBD0857289.1 hypothetical protein [Corynebacterium striatum]PIS59293.1 hypothetical protein AZH47_07160 [Corynebacterium striatum]PIS61605.1 hypothetical protein AZH45_08110 [Corynebacterium striatum]PIS67045.1 hypothetical protein AZH46_09215 [Corynebacterium striatum]PXY08314.1 hypothetical protein CKF72_08770 [Corynebacterium striatum]